MQPLGMFVLGLLMVAISATGLFASNEKLIRMRGIIGVKNPTVARVVCVFGLVLGSFFVVADIAERVGWRL